MKYFLFVLMVGFSSFVLGCEQNSPEYHLEQSEKASTILVVEIPDLAEQKALKTSIIEVIRGAYLAGSEIYVSILDSSIKAGAYLIYTNQEDLISLTCRNAVPAVAQFGYDTPLVIEIAKREIKNF